MFNSELLILIVSTLRYFTLFDFVSFDILFFMLILSFSVCSACSWRESVVETR